MKGNYVTKTGEVKNVTIFDDVNKMVCVLTETGNNEWYHEPDYSTWEKQSSEEPALEAAEEVIEDINEDVVEEATEEVEKPKRKTKKKAE